MIILVMAKRYNDIFLFWILLLDNHNHLPNTLSSYDRFHPNFRLSTTIISGQAQLCKPLLERFLALLRMNSLCRLNQGNDEGKRFKDALLFVIRVDLKTVITIMIVIPSLLSNNVAFRAPLSGITQVAFAYASGNVERK